MPRPEPDFELPWGGRNWGIECQQGWYRIIKELDVDLRQIYPDYKVTQVKEKFGGLRFYTDGVPAEVSDEFHARIRSAEHEAAMTCEWCGDKGRLQRGPWLRTLCEACQQKAGQRQMPWTD